MDVGEAFSEAEKQLIQAESYTNTQLIPNT